MVDIVGIKQSGGGWCFLGYSSVKACKTTFFNRISSIVLLNLQERLLEELHIKETAIGL